MKQKTKKWLGCAVTMLLATLAFSQDLKWINRGPIVLPKHEGSAKAHQQLTAKVFNMLLNKEYQKAIDFVNSIPKCPTGVIKSNEIPEYCDFPSDDPLGWAIPGTETVSWQVSYVDLEHYQDPSFIKKHVALNTVKPVLILYDAMLKHYEHMFGNLPYIKGNFNKDNYLHFYNIYKDTALEHIAKSAIYYWPHESFGSYDKTEGAEWYDRISLSVALGFQWQNEIVGYSYVCDTSSEEDSYYSRVQRLKDFLDATKAKADEMNDIEPFDIIKKEIVRDILSPKGYKKFLHWGDCRSYALNRYMSVLGSENEQEANELWKYLIVSPITEEMQINTQKLYELCWDNRNGYKIDDYHIKDPIEMKPIWCKNFRKNAYNYGFIADKTMELYRNSEQKKLQEKMMKALENGLYKPYKLPYQN